MKIRGCRNAEIYHVKGGNEDQRQDSGKHQPPMMVTAMEPNRLSLTRGNHAQHGQKAEPLVHEEEAGRDADDGKGKGQNNDQGLPDAVKQEHH